jgi:hypothetical protein
MLVSVGFVGYNLGSGEETRFVFGHLLDDKGIALPQQEPPEDPNQPWIEQVSWEPRIFLYHNILTQEECRAIIDLGSPDLSNSQVVAAGGKCKFGPPHIFLTIPIIPLLTLLAELSSVRTSTGVFLGLPYMSKSPLLRNVERRAEGMLKKRGNKQRGTSRAEE